MTGTPAIGSLFTGYGGLDLAAHAALGGRLAWTCDNDPGARRILAHHWPDTPNLGDITAVDWREVEPVDILTAGFPCQDLSTAGRRAGLAPGTRSGLWAHVADAIATLRPRLVIIENVRGILSAAAASDVEPCPWCVGGAGDGEPALRALGCVLGDLAGLGFDAEWHGLRAADVGAPHGRFRVFVLAWPTAPDPGGEAARLWAGLCASRSGRIGRGRPHHDGAQDVAADAGCDARSEDDPHEHPAAGRRRGAAADAACDGRDEGRPEPARLVRGPDAPVSGAAAPADPDSDAVRIEPVGEPGSSGAAEPGQARLDWGPYAAAVASWERVLGRPAPAPTEPSRAGGQRLSPRFVEHLMGLPDGWVTAVPGIPRNAQLKALGNGVVPQQAAAAIRVLVDRMAVCA